MEIEPEQDQQAETNLWLKLSLIFSVMVIFLVGSYFACKVFLFKPQEVVPITPPLTKAEECNKQVTNIKCKDGQKCMTNPASSFCACMGGSLEIREKTDGQYGVCLIDGKEYDEWDYFRTMNPQKQVEFRGWLTTIWGDGFSDETTEKKSEVSYTVSSGTQSYTLQTSDEIPSLLEFNGKEVQITGVKTEDPNTIKVISIKTVSSE